MIQRKLRSAKEEKYGTLRMLNGEDKTNEIERGRMILKEYQIKKENILDIILLFN